MLPDEEQCSERSVRMKLGKLRGGKEMAYGTLHRAIKLFGLPAHQNPFGRGYIFYWSEVQEWLRNPQHNGVAHEQKATISTRGPGRPRKADQANA